MSMEASPSTTTRGLARRVYARGLTLVEMLVAVGVFSAVIVISVGAAVVANDSFRKTQLQGTAIANVGVALETMARSIRAGSEYARDLGTPSRFSFLSEEGERIVYRRNGEQVEMSSDNGVSFRPITAPNLKIKNLTFWLTAGSATAQPRVTIVLGGVAQLPGKSQLDSTFDLQTTVSQRTIAGLGSGSPSWGAVCDGSPMLLHTYTEDNSMNSLCNLDVATGEVSSCRSTFPGAASEIVRSGGSLYAVRFGPGPAQSDLYRIDEATGVSTNVATVPEEYDGFCYYYHTVAVDPSIDRVYCSAGAGSEVRWLNFATGILTYAHGFDMYSLQYYNLPRFIASAYDVSGLAYYLGCSSSGCNYGDIRLQTFRYKTTPEDPLPRWAIPLPLIRGVDFDEIFANADVSNFSGEVSMTFGRDGFLYIADQAGIYRVDVEGISYDISDFQGYPSDYVSYTPHDPTSPDGISGISC